MLMSAEGNSYLPMLSTENYGAPESHALHTHSMDTLGKRIRYARETLAGVTQAAIARQFGITRNAVSAWESDKTIPATPKLRKIAEITGVSVQWLIYGGDLDPESGRPIDPVDDSLALFIARLTGAKRRKALAILQASFAYEEAEAPEKPTKKRA